MSTKDHIDALRQRHQKLEEKIHQENTRPMPDENVLHTLKKEKLALKEEISRLSS